MNDLALILNLFDEENTLTYRPELARRLGSVTAGILYQQMLYWWKKSKLKPFYKFKQPCGHSRYVEGDSWCEELAFSRREFDNALKLIGQKVSKGSKKNPDALVYYWTDMERVTRYDINQDAFRKVVIDLYGSDEQREALRKAEKQLYVKSESDSTKSSDPTLDNTETTPETNVQSLSHARKKIERTESGSVDVKSLKNRITEEAPPVAAAPPEEIDEFELLDDAVADLTRKATVSQQRLEVFNMSSMHKRTMDQAKEEAGRFAKWYMGRKIDEGWDAIRIANHFKAMKPSEAQAKYNASFWNKPYSQPQNNEQSTRNKKSERVYRSWDEVKSRLTA